jgi:hypothetical protein
LQSRRRGVFAVPVADHQRADLGADLPLSDALARFHHRARAFEARDVRRAGRHRVAAHALQAIGAVDPGGGDPDQHLAGLRLGHGPGHRHQHFGPAGRLDPDNSLGRWDIGKHRPVLSILGYSDDYIAWLRRDRAGANRQWANIGLILRM